MHSLRALLRRQTGSVHRSAGDTIEHGGIVGVMSKLLTAGNHLGSIGGIFTSVNGHQPTSSEAPHRLKLLRVLFYCPYIRSFCRIMIDFTTKFLQVRVHI